MPPVALLTPLHRCVLLLTPRLPQVRGLCRQQFFSRALGLKVATAQQLSAARVQQQPHPGAPQQQQHPGARAGGPGLAPGAGGGQQQRIETLAYPLAHGDAWSHGVQPPGAGGLPYGPAAVHTGMLTNPLAGSGR